MAGSLPLSLVPLFGFPAAIGSPPLHEEAEDLQSIPPIHSGLEDQDSPTDLQQEEVVAEEAEEEEAVVEEAEEEEEEGDSQQQETRITVPS